MASRESKVCYNVMNYEVLVSHTEWFDALPAGLDLKALGIPSRTQLLERYCSLNQEISFKEATEWSGFYLAFLFFKNCVIVQGVAQRAKAGVASSAIANRVSALLPTILRLCQEILQQYPPPLDRRSRL